MSILGEIEGFFTASEAEVNKIVAGIITSVEAAAKDIDSVFSWAEAAAPNITNDLAEAMPLVDAVAPLLVGTPTAAVLADAVTAANTAVAALNALAKVRASEQTSGANAVTADAASAVAAFQAVQTANAAVAAVKATASTVGVTTAP